MDSSRPAYGRQRTSRAGAVRGFTLLFLAALVLVAAGIVWTARGWRRRPSPPPDISVSEPAQPFLNTRPGVKYVGSARCAVCHAKEASTYAEHPMGRSVTSADHWLPAQHEAAASFEASGLHYAVDKRPNQTLHKEYAGDDGRVAAETVADIAFAVGSGRQGQSFLVNREGYLVLSPISWYSREKAWGLSPNFERKNEHFNRRVVEPCLACHTNEARTEPDTINRFRPPLQLEPIGCERCHGPGELHVEVHMHGEAPEGSDLTIVNPRHLEPQLREAVCQQCHLQGEARIVRKVRSVYDYRPGLPLTEFLSIYVRPAAEVDTRKAVSHVEQMYLSRCYRASAGKLGCISCHDSHVMPAAQERVPWYRGRCLNCHQDTSCAIALDERRRQNGTDSCIDCHMQRGDSSNIAHTAVTDHRIVRRPDLVIAADDNCAGFTLIPFHRDLVRPSDAGAQRDLGLALGELLNRPFPEPQRRQIARQASSLLGPTVASAPDDVAALEGLGFALWKDKRPREALGALEKALERTPRRELALETAALVTMELGDYEHSVAYWRRVLEVNPYNWQNHGFLAQALALQQQWPAAVDACRSALQLNPFEVATRRLLIDCLSRIGEKKQAQAEFDTLLALHPPEPEQLRRWFEELMRPRSGP